MSKSRKSLTKDKLVGMKVIDSEGNLLGTVNDVAFTVGKFGISLSVENKAGEIAEVPWEQVQSAGDFILLKPPDGNASSTAGTSPSSLPNMWRLTHVY